MCGFYCIAFIEYMVAGKTLLDYNYKNNYKNYKITINTINTNNYKKNDKITYKYFNDKYGV